MNSSNEAEQEKYSDDPDALFELVDSVLNKFVVSVKDPELVQKQTQLIKVSRAIDQLSDLSVPIPDELRNLKLNLLAEIESKSRIREELEQLVTRLGDILTRIESSYSNKPSRKRTRKSKSKLPRTKKEVLEGEIVYALRELVGKGTAKEVKDIIKESMKDKFFTR